MSRGYNKSSTQLKEEICHCICVLTKKKRTRINICNRHPHRVIVVVVVVVVICNAKFDSWKQCSALLSHHVYNPSFPLDRKTRIVSGSPSIFIAARPNTSYTKWQKKKKEKKKKKLCMIKQMLRINYYIRNARKI